MFKILLPLLFIMLHKTEKQAQWIAHLVLVAALVADVVRRVFYHEHDHRSGGGDGISWIVSRKEKNVKTSTVVERNVTFKNYHVATRVD